MDPAPTPCLHFKFLLEKYRNNEALKGTITDYTKNFLIFKSPEGIWVPQPHHFSCIPPKAYNRLFFIGFPGGVVLDSSSPFLLACHEAEVCALVRVILRVRGFSWMLCFCLILAREEDLFFSESHFSLTLAYRIHIYIYWSTSLHVFFSISSQSLFYFLICYIPFFFFLSPTCRCRWMAATWHGLFGS